MNVSKFHTFSRTYLCLSFIAVIYGSHSFATEDITATLVSDKDRYIVSDDITLTLTLTNTSKSEITLASRRGALLALGIYRNGRIFQILPDQTFKEKTISLPANETIMVIYSFPAYRIAVHAPHTSMTDTSLQVDVQGPWLKDTPSILSRLDLIVDGVSRLVEEKTTGQQFGETARLLKKNAWKHDFSPNAETRFVRLDDREYVTLSEIPEIQAFVEENSGFDGLVVDHIYITGGDFYDERIVILSSRNDTIKTVLLRTWAHIQSEYPPRILEYFELPDCRKVKSTSERFYVNYKSPDDFGFMKVTDNWTGDVVFDASSVWGGPGVMRFPRHQVKEEIRNLRVEQQLFMQSISRDIYISWKGSKYDLETFLYPHDYRIKRPTVSENSPHARFLITIPPDLSRMEAIDFLKQYPDIFVWELKTIDGQLVFSVSE